MQSKRYVAMHIQRLHRISKDVTHCKSGINKMALMTCVNYPMARQWTFTDTIMNRLINAGRMR